MTKKWALEFHLRARTLQLTCCTAPKVLSWCMARPRPGSTCPPSLGICPLTHLFHFGQNRIEDAQHRGDVHPLLPAPPHRLPPGGIALPQRDCSSMRMKKRRGNREAATASPLPNEPPRHDSAQRRDGEVQWFPQSARVFSSFAFALSRFHIKRTQTSTWLIFNRERQAPSQPYRCLTCSWPRRIWGKLQHLPEDATQQGTQGRATNERGRQPETRPVG